MSNQAAYLDGKDQKLRIDSAEMPKPNSNEVVIKNHAIAINPVDWKIQDSGMFIKNWPIVIGCDVAGEITEVGSDVKHLSKGDRVFGHTTSLVTQDSKNGAFQLYSATPAAEAYFKTLIIEFEKKKAEGRRELQERQKQRSAGVRLVTDGETIMGRGSSESERIRTRARDDTVMQGLPAPGMDWSPVEKRRAMTPTEGRGWTFTPDGMRPRAETAESSGTV